MKTASQTSNTLFPKALVSLGLLLSLLVHPTISQAQQVAISPLRVNFKVDQTSEILTVRNTSSTPFTLQPKVVKWSQEGGKDVFENTRDVLVAPPIVEVAPGESQIIRLALRRAPDAKQELSYRVFVQQVLASKANEGSGVNFAFSLSLPIFVAPALAAGSPQPRPDLQWSGKMIDKSLQLTATNPSSMHVQVRKLRVESSAGNSDLQQMIYVLPGQQQQVSIKPPAGLSGAGQKFGVIADTDAGEMRREASLQ